MFEQLSDVKSTSVCFILKYSCADFSDDKPHVPSFNITTRNRSNSISRDACYRGIMLFVLGIGTTASVIVNHDMPKKAQCYRCIM